MELNCPNCGAPVKGYRCEYCGTPFEGPRRYCIADPDALLLKQTQIQMNMELRGYMIKDLEEHMKKSRMRVIWD